MNVYPIHDFVLVQPDEAKQKTDGGLVLPDSSLERPKTGKVLAVGPGRTRDGDGQSIPLQVKRGDHVLFSEYSGVDFDGKKLLKEENILAVLS